MWVRDVDLQRATYPDTCDVTIRMLGRFAVGVGDTWVDGWGGQRPRNLLQYLMVRRLPVHREVLMELLWPGYSYASARNNLNVCLYSLRRTVGTAANGEHIVVYRDGCYSLNEGLAWNIDRDRFAAASSAFRRLDAAARFGEAMAAGSRAVAAYGGPLFDGDLVADWFGPERVALHETYLDVLERLAELDLDDGDVGGAELSLRRLLRHDACRESAHRLLMSCFAHRGQRDLVVRQYRRCVAVLQGELDVDPSPQTVELFCRLVDLSRASVRG
jgi:DNA-binding SARP family transcriptional activator